MFFNAAEYFNIVFSQKPRRSCTPELKFPKIFFPEFIYLNEYGDATREFAVFKDGNMKSDREESLYGHEYVANYRLMRRHNLLNVFLMCQVAAYEGFIVRISIYDFSFRVDSCNRLDKIFVYFVVILVERFAFRVKILYKIEIREKCQFILVIFKKRSNSLRGRLRCNQLLLVEFINGSFFDIVVNSVEKKEKDGKRCRY